MTDKTEEGEVSDAERDRKLILESAQRDYGLTGDDFEHDEDDNRVRLNLGRWYVVTEDEDRGLYADDEGELHASVVGAPEYHNERVAYYFVPDGHEVGTEAVPFEDIEAV